MKPHIDGTEFGSIFLKRTMIQCEGPNDRTRHHHLLKYGLEPNYWNEFVFKAYHHHQHDATQTN